MTNTTNKTVEAVLADVLLIEEQLMRLPFCDPRTKMHESVERMKAALLKVLEPEDE